jgi:general secretion pathway protein H
MPTLAAGNEPRRLNLRWPKLGRGFTLLEILVVVALIAVASSAVVLALRDGSESALEREGERLAALFDAARAQSRATGVAASWQPTEGGFAFNPTGDSPNKWLNPQVSARITTVGDNAATIQLGPEPLVGAQSVQLTLGKRVAVVQTDGLRPFSANVLAAASDAAQP